MPLILAIEPDRRQASQLTAMVRERLGAELVLADSAEKALAGLGSRVPDLILTSALLSTKDEAALADRLRALDTAAAHVQTLTIPVLGTPRPRSNPGRSMLSALLGDRPQAPSAPDGCDPAVFADQCGAYLERAAAERASLQNGRAAEPRELPDVPELPKLPEQHDEAAIAFQEASTNFNDTDAEVDLSPMLDEKVVEQLTAAIEAVTASQHVDLGPHDDAKETAIAPALTPKRQPKTRKPKARPTLPPDVNLFDPDQCGFAALLAKLDEITHVASPLPPHESAAGSFDVTP